jgi:GNAT superfamily N-acetyltransferase
VRPPVATRRATADDVDTLLAHVQAGFDSYREFAPAGWMAPDVRSNRGLTVELLRDPGTWGLLAIDGADPAGHVAFFAGRERREPHSPGDWWPRPVIPGLAHLWQLFVLPGWWGRGVAPLLHDAALVEMRARGYERGRLYTPTAHRRARRFYERRGWTAADESWNSELGLELIEYWITLD